MSIMDNIKKRMQSWLQINPPISMLINIQELFDWSGNAIKNRIWYRGDANEIEQLYWQIPKGVMNDVTSQRFWASHPTPGMEMRKIHTGLPATIVDTITGIVVSNINDFKFDGNQIVEQMWTEHIEPENRVKQIIEKAVKDTLVIGDGAFKVSVDSELSEYPIIEFYAGDKVDYVIKRGRIQEVVFKSYYDGEGTTLELKEHYGHGYIDYELLKGDIPMDMSVDARFNGLERVEWDGDDMLAVPVKFYSSNKWEGRGQSIFDRKIDAFDSFDECYSQWIDALRAGRTKEYIPDTLLPRDPHSGAVLNPNPFDNRYIRTDSDMRERGENKIATESAVIQHDSYMSTYITALDLCLQGIISPATLGIDVKKLDNAEAQREKEKVTLYTRDTIIEALQPQIEELIYTVVRTHCRTLNTEMPEFNVDVTFQDYANPSFESQIETVGKGRAHGILSIEACVEELYGDDRDQAWKDEEVARLKREHGLVELEEPAVSADKMWKDILSDGQNALA